MTPELLELHVEESIAKALHHEAWIDAGVLDIKGFSTGCQRRLISNLAHLPKPDPVYLEVGLYAGATFCAAINNNPTLTAIGIENFSQSFGDDTIQVLMAENIEHYRKGAKDIRLIDADCFKMSALLAGIPPVDVYFFDGEHSRASQAKALPEFLHVLAPNSIFVVDDSNWESVRDGTNDGLRAVSEQGVVIHRRWHLTGDKQQDDAIWHNGMDILVLSKPE